MMRKINSELHGSPPLNLKRSSRASQQVHTPKAALLASSTFEVVPLHASRHELLLVPTLHERAHRVPSGVVQHLHGQRAQHRRHWLVLLPIAPTVGRSRITRAGQLPDTV